MIMDDQEAVPEFPAGHTVLALYPSTTCFYKAIVVRPPSKVQVSTSLFFRTSMLLLSFFLIQSTSSFGGYGIKIGHRSLDAALHHQI
jgi:hypothetical protein